MNAAERRHLNSTNSKAMHICWYMISATLRVLMVIALLSNLIGRVAAGPGKNYVCRRENFLGSNCGTNKCQSEPGTYAGLHCTCQPCPSTVGNSAFDHKMYYCLTSHFKACPEIQLTTTGNINKDRSQQQQGSTADTTTPSPNSTQVVQETQQFALQYKVDGETANKTKGVELPTGPRRPAAMWAGLALGLSILIVGAAALIGWYFWDKQRLDKKRSRGSDELLKGAAGREAGAGQTAADNGQPQEKRRMFSPPEAAPDE